jgi:hypothetical protein
MTAATWEIKYTTKDAEKVAEIRRIFGKDADAILQKYGTLAYDFMYENAKHNFKNFSYTSPENLHSKMKAYLLDQTTRPEDVVLYTAREQNWDWKVRASQVQEARKAAHKVVAAEKSAKPKAAAPASKVNWTAAQQASLKKWQGQAQLSDADYKKLEAKYGADLYKIMQNVVLQPSAVMSALKGGYKNSADTTQYLLSNTLSAEQVNKIVTLAHPQPQRTAASQAQSTDSNSEVNEVTVVGQKPVGKEKVLGIIPDPATAIYGVNKKIPELKLNNTTYETAAGRKARLEQEKKAKEERKKLVEKEASELAAKVKALKAAGKPVDVADVERLGALNTEKSQLEVSLKQLKADVKTAAKEAKKAEKAAKKAEKEEKKKAKAEAKAKKKADKEAEATEATGEKKGNIFTRTRDTVKGWFSKKKKTESTEVTTDATEKTETEVTDDDTKAALQVQNVVGGEDVQLSEELIKQNKKMVEAIENKDQSQTPESNTQGQGQQTPAKYGYDDIYGR